MQSLRGNLTRSSIGSFLRAFDLVFLVAFIWFMVQFLRYVFPPLFGTFQATYGVSNTGTGVLFTLLMLGYSAMQFPAGWLADRLDEVTVILGGIGLFSAAAVFAFFAPTFALLTIAAVGIGVGTGVHKTVAIPFLSRTYPDRPGLALGVMDTIGQFGGMIAPIIVVALLASVLPWGSVFLLGAAVSVALGFALYRSARRGTDDGHQSNGESDDGNTEGANDAVGNPHSESDGGQEAVSYVRIFADRKLLVFLAITVAFTFSWNGLSAFFPLFLADEKGLSPGVAGFAYSLLFAASVSQTVTGGMSDRLGRLNISLALFAVMVVGLLTLLLVDSVLLILLLTLVTGVGFHGFRPVRDSYLMVLIPDSIGGGTLGIVRTIMTVVGALAPAAIGVLSDQLGYVVAFGSIVATLTVGGLLIILLR